MLKTTLQVLLLASTLLWLPSCQQSASTAADVVTNEAGIPLDSLVRRVAIPSVVMSQTYNAYVILPESYYTDTLLRAYPVVYLLHGYSGKFSDWYDREPALRDYATRYDLILVTPEGSTNGWYIDSPVDSSSQFETYVGATVPNFIDENFRTLREREGRAIAGLSMGGYGALRLALRHPNWFGAVGSMSGVVDLRPFANRWDLPLRLGDSVEQADRFAEYSLINLLSQAGRNAPRIMMDCGLEDELVNVNRELHVAMIEANINHIYSERPGGHDWLYWQEALPYHLLFFQRYFASR